MLHLRPGVKDVFLARLGESHPHLVADYRRRYRDRAYAPQADQQALDAVVRDLVRSHGGIVADRSDPRHMTGHNGDDLPPVAVAPPAIRRRPVRRTEAPAPAAAHGDAAQLSLL